MRRVELLRSHIKNKSITYNWHSPEQSFIEAVFSRGDRRLGNVIFTAFKAGAKMDSWSEFFSYSKWINAFEECGINPVFYASRERDAFEILPWGVVSAGICNE